MEHAHLDRSALLLVESARPGYAGIHEGPVWLSLLATGFVAAASFASAAALLARGGRLKP